MFCLCLQKLATLLALHEAISEALSKLDMNSIQAAPAQPNRNAGNNVYNDNWWDRQDQWNPDVYDDVLRQGAEFRGEKEEVIVEEDSDHEGAEVRAASHIFALMPIFF